MNDNDQRPNIIFVMVDQMRGDCMHADGHPVIQTPNLDDLASRGTRFRHAYTSVPSCLPARAVLWTGQEPWHAGLLGMGAGQGPIPNDYPHTLPGELSSAGYRTHMIGKGHFHPHRAGMGFQTAELDESGRMPDSDYRQWFRQNAPAGITPDDHGVDWNSWHARPWHCDEHLHPTHWTMTRALEWLQNREGDDRPCFLNISFARPHSPYVPPASYFSYYLQGETPPPYVGAWSAMHEEAANEGIHGANAWRGKMSPRQIHLARSGYYGEISFIDTQLGRLLQWMRRNAAAGGRPTWLAFCADHGDMQGDHHLWRKTYAYEGSTRIPFLLVPPAGTGDARRRVADEVVELRDMMPTLLSVAGLPPPKTVDGVNLLPLLRAPATKWRSHIHGEHCTCYDPEQEMQYVTDGRRKFIWLPRLDRRQFFDLQQDPGECHDLIDDPSRRDEIDLWRSRLVADLESRQCGWTRDGQLCPPSEGPLVSPWHDRRWRG